MNFAYRYIQFNLKWIILFFFKKVHYKGLHHIPKKSAVIYVVNHQNTVVDALLTGIPLQKELNFLVKADAFKADAILVEWFENKNLGMSINDRLKRASSK